MNMQKIKQMAQELHDAFPGLGITLTTTANGEKGIHFCYGQIFGSDWPGGYPSLHRC